jgi:hypothetical protein
LWSGKVHQIPYEISVSHHNRENQTFRSGKSLSENQFWPAVSTAPTDTGSFVRKPEWDALAACHTPFIAVFTALLSRVA